MRDIHKNQSYFLNRLKEDDQVREKLIERRKFLAESGRLKPRNHNAILVGLYMDSVQSCFAAYSLGYSPDDIGKYYAVAKQDFLNYRREGIFTSVEKTKLVDRVGNVDLTSLYHYWIFFSLISLGILLEDSKDNLSQLFFESDWELNQDKLLSWLATKAKITTKSNSVRLHEEYYDNLYQSISSDAPSEQNALIANFLDSFYENSRDWVWYDSHKQIDYYGYWRFDVAAIVKLLGIDDSSFRDHPYYPKDLV